MLRPIKSPKIPPPSKHKTPRSKRTRSSTRSNNIRESMGCGSLKLRRQRNTTQFPPSTVGKLTVDVCDHKILVFVQTRKPFSIMSFRDAIVHESRCTKPSTTSLHMRVASADSRGLRQKVVLMTSVNSAIFAISAFNFISDYDFTARLYHSGPGRH